MMMLSHHFGFPTMASSYLFSERDTHGLSMEKAKFCLNFALHILVNIENSNLVAVSVEKGGDELIIIVNQKVMSELSKKEYEIQFKDSYKKLSWKKRKTTSDTEEFREKIKVLMEQAAERSWQRYVQKIRSMIITMALYSLQEFQVIIHEVNDSTSRLQKTRFFEIIQSLDKRYHNITVDHVLKYINYWLTSLVLLIITTSKYLEIPIPTFKITNLHDHKKLSYGITISKVTEGSASSSSKDKVRTIYSK